MVLDNLAATPVLPALCNLRKVSCWISLMVWFSTREYSVFSTDQPLLGSLQSGCGDELPQPLDHSYHLVLGSGLPLKMEGPLFAIMTNPLISLPLWNCLIFSISLPTGREADLPCWKHIKQDHTQDRVGVSTYLGGARIPRCAEEYKTL